MATNKHLYLSLGSDEGDRAGHLLAGLKSLQQEIGCLIAVSGIYETEPWKMQGPLFLNQVVCLDCELSPEVALRRIHEIEKKLGRKRLPGTVNASVNETDTLGYRPRTLDIDILLYGEKIIHTPELVIPHPLLSERRFVLVPLAEIAPEVMHPVLFIPVREILKGCRDTRTVKQWKQSGQEGDDQL